MDQSSSTCPFNKDLLKGDGCCRGGLLCGASDPGAERRHRGVDLLECNMPESCLDWHQTKCLPRSHKRRGPGLVKQESRRLRFLRQGRPPLCPGLRTDGIPAHRCCCCCCRPAVAPDVQNRSLTSAWLLEYTDIPRIKSTQGTVTHRIDLKRNSMDPSRLRLRSINAA